MNLAGFGLSPKIELTATIIPLSRLGSVGTDAV